MSEAVDTPEVSIVLCAWNPREDWFREAVLSALGQDGCALELVIVDDGSVEPVSALLGGISDVRSRVIRVEHGGLSRARNAGTRVARGRFLRYADADDVLEPRSTARLLALARGGMIAYGATMICDDHLHPLGVKTSHLQGWVAEQCLRYRFDVRHMSMLFPRSVVDAVGEWEPSLEQCQDWDFVLRALEHAPVVADAGIATYYRRHGSSASANLAGALAYETKVVDRYFERHPEEVGGALEREIRAKLLVVRARAAPALGYRRRERIGLLLRALTLHPRRVVEELSGDLVRRLARGRRSDRVEAPLLPG